MRFVTKIRTARPAEMDVLVELQRRASMVWEEYREQLLAHPDAIEVPADALGRGEVRVAVVSGTIGAFATVLRGTPGAGELDGLFVEPALMRHGLGRLLLDDAATRARRQGITRLEVTANPRAVGFYEKVGFVTDGAVPTRFGPGTRMHRALAD